MRNSRKQTRRGVVTRRRMAGRSEGLESDPSAFSSSSRYSDFTIVDHSFAALKASRSTLITYTTSPRQSGSVQCFPIHIITSNPWEHLESSLLNRPRAHDKSDGGPHSSPLYSSGCRQCLADLSRAASSSSDHRSTRSDKPAQAPLASPWSVEFPHG